MPWDFDDSEPVISPEKALAYYGELLGGAQDGLALPEMLVATFQQKALERMVAQIGAEVTTRWPTPIFWPLARGSFQSRSLAVARLPMGAAAAASALELMIAAGVKKVLLVGSAGSLQPRLPVGSLAVLTEAIAQEGTSHHYLRSGETAPASTELVDALVSAASARTGAAPAQGLTWTTDALYRECSDTVARMRASGILTVEMEAAAIFAVAHHRGVRVALIVAISDELWDSWRPGFHTVGYTRSLLRAADIALQAAASL